MIKMTRGPVPAAATICLVGAGTAGCSPEHRDPPAPRRSRFPTATRVLQGWRAERNHGVNRTVPVAKETPAQSPNQWVAVHGKVVDAGLPPVLARTVMAGYGSRRAATEDPGLRVRP
jgi:hypothetical protein